MGQPKQSRPISLTVISDIVHSLSNPSRKWRIKNTQVFLIKLLRQGPLLFYIMNIGRMKQRGKISDGKFIGLISAITAVVITVAIVIMNEALTK